MRIAAVLWATIMACPLLSQPAELGQRLAPFVPSPQEIIERMLEIAQIKPYEVVYDLGCGDGRILITAVQKYRAKSVGVEIDSKIAAQASETIHKLGLQNHARVVRANVFDVDLSPADVVTLYLTTTFNEKLRPKLEKSLKSGARIVSHDYGIRGWNPVEVEELFIHGRRHRIFLYKVDPAAKKQD
jgi:predicted RNA methylase